MGCTTTNVTTEIRYDCVRVCNDPTIITPVADYIFSNFILTQNATWDNALIYNQRFYKWQILYQEQIIYDSGYGLENDPLLDFSFDSTHGSINLGINNLNVFNLLNNQNILYNNELFKIKLFIIDAFNNEASICKYYFSK